MILSLADSPRGSYNGTTHRANRRAQILPCRKRERPHAVQVRHSPLISSRTETLRAVNHLPEDYAFSEEFLEASREYFREGDQTTVLALEEGRLAGCATLCYIDLMPTFSHPSGRRGHLMNVYTAPAFRRRGVGKQMVSLLIDEARGRGITEISLDATEAGRPLYRALGFRDSGERMVLELKQE